MSKPNLETLYLDAYGPMVIGNFFSWLLLGVLCVIAYKYFTRQRNDPVGNKIVAYVLMVATILDTAFGCSRIIKVCVVHPGDLKYFDDLVTRKEDFLSALMSNICTALTQSFMAYKAASFGCTMKDTYGPKLRWATTVLKLLLCGGVIANWCLGLGVPIYFATFKSYTAIFGADLAGHGPFHRWADAQISGFLAVDILLTLILTLELRNARTGFAASNAILDAVITITLRNGLIVTICQSSQLIIGQTVTSTWSALTFTFISKIYTMTVFSLLIRPKQVHREWQRRLDAESADPNAPSQSLSSNAGLGDQLDRSSTGVEVNSRETFSISKSTASAASGSNIMTPQSSSIAAVLGGGMNYTLPYTDKDRDRIQTSSGERRERSIGFKAALLDLDLYEPDESEKEDSLQGGGNERSETEKGD